MHAELKKLLILQNKDTKLYNAKSDIESIPQEAAKIKSSLADKLTSVAEAKKAVLIAQKNVQQLELDRQTRKDTILKLKTRQGETKRNEEYQMLSHEIIRYNNEIDELETRELELMEIVDLKMSLRKESEKQFNDEKGFATELSKNLLKKKAVAEKDVEVLQVERDEISVTIDPVSYELYERIIKSRGVGAIVEVTASGQCTGCNIKLPPATLHNVLASNELVQCSECSRILYNA